MGQGRKQRKGFAAFTKDEEWGKKPRLMVTSTRHIIGIVIIQLPALSCQGYLVVDMGLFSAGLQKGLVELQNYGP